MRTVEEFVSPGLSCPPENPFPFYKIPCITVRKEMISKWCGRGIVHLQSAPMAFFVYMRVSTNDPSPEAVPQVSAISICFIFTRPVPLFSSFLPPAFRFLCLIIFRFRQFSFVATIPFCPPGARTTCLPDWISRGRRDCSNQEINSAFSCAFV